MKKEEWNRKSSRLFKKLGESFDFENEYSPHFDSDFLTLGYHVVDRKDTCVADN